MKFVQLICDNFLSNILIFVTITTFFLNYGYSISCFLKSYSNNTSLEQNP